MTGLWTIQQSGSRALLNMTVTVVACLCGSTVSAAYAEQYTIIDAPGAGIASGQGTETAGVNKLSAATGWYRDGSNNYHGYLRGADGTFTTFDVGGASSQTQPTKINDKGVIVGTYHDANAGIQKGFLRKPGGKIETYDGAGGNSTSTHVESINDKREVAGFYYDANGLGHAFVRARDGAVTVFEDPNAGTGKNQGTFTFDISGDGTVVGTYIDSTNVLHGYARSADGTFTEFDAPGAGTLAGQGTLALGVNRKAWMAGYYFDSTNVLNGFVRDYVGAVTTFSAPDAGHAVGQGTFGGRINGHGDMAGHYIDAHDAGGNGADFDHRRRNVNRAALAWAK